MRGFWKRYRKLHSWLATNLILLAAFFLTRGRRAWMNTLEARVTGPLRRHIGDLCYHTNFSVMEILCVVLVLFFAGYVAGNAAAVVRAKGHRWRRAYGAVLGAVCVVLTIYVGSCFLWGINYYTDSFQDKSGIHAEKVAEGDLYRVTAYFAQQLKDTAGRVPRSGSGQFAVPRAQIFRESTSVYSAVERDYPFMKFPDRVPKKVHFSKVMSLLDFTGVYCPFTGESNLNVDSPASLLPSTIAHELAHQRGFSSEQECNFLGVLASTTCGHPDYAYSGWLLGYIYLGNALYSSDRAKWKTVYFSLPLMVRADLDANNAYWDRFHNKMVKKISNRVYDSYLKGYGETKGLQSYGTVVDMLVAYYKNKI